MEVENTFKLIDVGLTHTHPHPSQKAILLVGLTGAGKTTLAKFITGDNNRLMSVAEGDNSTDSNDSEEAIHEYYVTDIDDDKIGSDITISKTSYPETYVDQTNGEVIIDCPGFADTRGQAHEIAIAVVMKNIFRWATQVKIILVINHGEVRKGCSRNEFSNLLRFLSILLKDVSHFHTSIGMIVTKVTNEYPNRKSVATDTQMITLIAKHLSSVEKELTQLNSDNSKIVLVQSLIKKIGSNYPNIAIFRKPYESGSLESIPEIQEGKKKIIETLYSNLMYANVTESSVGLSISKDSELLVITMCSNIKKNVDTQLKYLNENFRQHYKNQIDQARNYDELRDLLQKEKNCFDSSELDKILDFESQLKMFFDILTTKKLRIYVSPDAMYSNLINQLTHLKLLQKLSNDDLTKSDSNWSSIVPDLVQHLVSLSDWYNFIVTAFERMSQNDVQANKSNLGVELTNWASFKTYVVTELNLKLDPNVMKKLTLEVYEQKSLTDILKVISEPAKVRQIPRDTDKCEIVIEGYFLRTSDIETLIKPYNNKPLSAIHVFAQYTVFFDSSINKDGSELLLSVIAPKWEIIDQQKISLNGINASNPAYTVAEHGKAGDPGGQAGTFFGVGYDFVNGENLNVYTNGGVGGDGQNGEKGTDGHGDIDVSDAKYLFCDDKYIIYPNTRRHRRNNILYVAEYDVTIVVKIEEGPEATVGYDGGKPGLGGYNGISSEIKSLNKNKPSNIVLHNNRGANGQPGKGGNGGIGGIINGKIVFKTKATIFLITPLAFTCDIQQQVLGHPKPSPRSGFDGIKGTLIQPKQTVPITLPILTSYRKFLVAQTTDPNTVNAISSYKLFLNMI